MKGAAGSHMAGTWQAPGTALVLAVPFPGGADYKLQDYWGNGEFFVCTECLGRISGKASDWRAGARGGPRRAVARDRGHGYSRLWSRR
ncbi:MAG TPA: hypothetical protein VEZ52_04365 [Desulfovibrio sp.]|uniref:hypothetical protein n=1 Tax=Desulfovibrio sp. TaxID=885 RepID=UPI002D5FE908|nr:hypothetical protein [Desulfovibrio sp.]HZF60840.1 hypothetical protein [Desulfovibrio sp.]